MFNNTIKMLACTLALSTASFASLKPSALLEGSFIDDEKLPDLISPLSAINISPEQNLSQVPLESACLSDSEATPGQLRYRAYVEQYLRLVAWHQPLVKLNMCGSAENNSMDFENLSKQKAELVDECVGDLSVDEMKTTDDDGIDHYAYAFYASLENLERIIYYVHGGPGLTLNNPNSLKFSPDFIRNNSNIRHFQLGVCYSANITLRSLPFIKNLVQENCLVVCLNYPGSLTHGENWNDLEYSNDERASVAEFESELAKIIKDQIVALTTRIKDKYKVSGVPATYWGHSLGGTIGQHLIINHSKFLEDHMSLVILASPGVKYGIFESFPKPEDLKNLYKKHLYDEYLEKLENSKCAVPITIISCENDTTVPSSIHAIPMFNALSKNNSKVYYSQIEKAGHSPHNMLDLLADLFIDTKDLSEVMEEIKANEADAIEISDDYLRLVLEASRRTCVEIP